MKKLNLWIFFISNYLNKCANLYYLTQQFESLSQHYKLINLTLQLIFNKKNFKMAQTIQKKPSKSKQWIDYTSQEDNSSEDQKQTKNHHHHNHQKLESATVSQNAQKQKKQKQSNLPVLSSSHEPVKKHIIDDRKQQLQILREIKKDFVWIQLSIENQKDFQYLNQKINQLKTQSHKQIFNIYTSRQNKNAFDLKIHPDLCEKWIVEGFEHRNIINLKVLKKTATKPKQQRYQPKDRDYNPIRQNYPQHTSSTRYQPKYQPKHAYIPKQEENQKKSHLKYQPKHAYIPKQEEHQKKSYLKQQPKHTYIPKQEEHQRKSYLKQQPKHTYIPKQEEHQKKRYIQRNPLAQKLEQKVEEELAQKKLNKKEKPKKEKGSKFYSKNPFEDLGKESDN